MTISFKVMLENKASIARREQEATRGSDAGGTRSGLEHDPGREAVGQRQVFGKR